jgi:hypothetical protein
MVTGICHVTFGWACAIETRRPVMAASRATLLKAWDFMMLLSRFEDLMLSIFFGEEN